MVLGMEKEFWNLIKELERQKISEEVWREIQKIIDQVIGVIVCKGSWAVDYGSALEATKKVLEKKI